MFNDDGVENMSIQLFMPTFHVEECLVEIKECLERGWTGLGYKTVQFEDAWKQYTNLPMRILLTQQRQVYIWRSNY